MSLYDESGRVLVSPSRLKTWLECPLKWRAVYVEEIKTPPTPAMAFGTAVHRALELFHRSRWLNTSITLEEVKQEFSVALQAELKAFGEPEPSLLATGATLVELYCNRYGNEQVSAAELSLAAPVINLETGEDLGATLVGVIDLITASGVVVDVKTSARSADFFDLVLSHSLQLDAYRWLMQHNGKQVEGEIRLLVKKKVPTIEAFKLPSRTFESFFDVCRRYVAFVREGGATDPRPGFFCGETCPAYKLCRLHHGLEAA